MRPARSRMLALAAASGALLFLSDYPVHAWPLQWVALLPLLLAIERAPSYRDAALAGAVTGLFYEVPLRIVLATPFPLGEALVLYLTAWWALMALGFRWVQRWPAFWCPLGRAAIAVVIAWANMTLVPVWGTAQCFARVGSASPRLMQVVGLAGMTGLVFLLVATQALALRVGTCPRERRQSLLALASLIAVVASYSAWAWQKPASSHLRVAAMGWAGEPTHRIGRASPLALLSSLYEPLLAQAAAKGAELVVTPEAGIVLGAEDRVPVFARLASLAARYRLTLVVGYFDASRDTNLMRVIAPDGGLAGDYAKTHLVAFHERYVAGNGDMLLARLASGQLVGGMICQDDNFTDLARSYGRAAVDLLAVPTKDWVTAKDYHLENSIFRAVENRVGIVRAASDGISAVISPRGEILARMDHLTEGAGLITADLPMTGGGTFYSHAGEWLPAAALAFLLSFAALDRQRRRKQA